MTTWAEFLGLDEDEQATAALDVLSAVIQSRPNGYSYVYQSPMYPGGACVYVYGGKPSCLIGHALVRMGYSGDVSLSALGSIAANWPRLGIHRATAQIWAAAQGAQDDSAPWGAALAAAQAVRNVVTV